MRLQKEAILSSGEQEIFRRFQIFYIGKRTFLHKKEPHRINGFLCNSVMREQSGSCCSQGHHVFTQAQPQKALVPVRRYKRYLSSSLLVFHKEIVWHINSTSWIVIRIPRRRYIVNNVLVLLEAACYTLSTEQSCYRVADLYSYIEWGWCWWTKNRLTLKTLWLLVCLFLHCWHSFLRFWSSAVCIEKPPS